MSKLYLNVFVGYHGKNGPMKIKDLQETPLVTSFLDACKELDFSIKDINGADILGNISLLDIFHNFIIVICKHSLQYVPLSLLAR